MFFLGFAFLLLHSPPGTLSNAYDTMEHYCPDHQPQRAVDIDQVMGMWYVIEIIQHQRDEPSAQGSIILQTCPTLHIARESRSDMRLVWNERIITLYYNVRMTDPHSPGFWTASGPHNESTPFDQYHGAFTGVIQVMKAVGNHMALTFCTRQPLQLFSVLLSRETKLGRQQIQSVNSMLQRRGLNAQFIKHACSGGKRSYTVERAWCWLLVLPLVARWY